MWYNKYKYLLYVDGQGDAFASLTPARMANYTNSAALHGIISKKDGIPKGRVPLAEVRGQSPCGLGDASKEGMDLENVVVPGIGVGAMSDKYQIKVLICYLLHSVPSPLSKEQLGAVFQEGQYVNYFSFCDALQELTDAGHLSLDSDGRYILEPLGVEIAKRLERNLPKSLRDNVVTAAMHLIAQLKVERENEVRILPHQNGFMVHCTSHDGSFVILKLELYAPDQIQAERIRERFLADPAGIYQQVAGLLIGELEA